MASLLSFTRLSQRGFLILISIIGLAFWILCQLAPFLPMEGKIEVLAPYNAVMHATLMMMAAGIGALSTWGFWRLKDTPTIELLVLLSCSILALAGHREFHLDNPQALSTIAWDLGIDQIYMFAVTGMLIAAIVLTYLSLASLPARQRLLNQWGDFSLKQGRRSWSRTVATLLLLGALFGSAFYFVYGFYHQVSGARLANGVGEGGQEGLSPLGFHSALGSTNQPAALVRLDGDYRENPFTPMLYLRENALSDYNGHEMVIAKATYDTDVAGNHPGEGYEGQERPELISRTPVTQSIYLLADHKLTMSVDYPLTIRPLKNPNPTKFKGSFRAVSSAPAFTPEMLAQESVGNPDWSEETRAHYLKTTEDPRYQELALTITAQADTPLKKVQALIQYLSERSIYTLTPNHQVDKEDDQTAPYLFGDMRGYCVHFAHATVYMLRSLGIPARIGTGYLTDLSQSKDGHILLRMSDRHAWAEVYVHELGWVPFDTQPAQVENHADTQVDMKLLEDLMGMLEPGEEILPKDLTDDEPAFEPHWDWTVVLPSRMTVIAGFAALLLALILSKLYLRYGWMIARSPRQRLARSYISLASRLSDLGYHRTLGETRSEYRIRLGMLLGEDTLSIGELLTQSVYAPPGQVRLEVSSIDQARQRDQEPIRKLPLLKRLGAALNPASLVQFFSRSGW